jgi:hypothetical protein
MNCFKGMFTDGTDELLSSKRVITFVAFLLCAIAFMVDLLTDYEAKPALFDSMMYIVIAGLGFTASEKFAKKDTK